MLTNNSGILVDVIFVDLLLCQQPAIPVCNSKKIGHNFISSLTACNLNTSGFVSVKIS